MNARIKYVVAARPYEYEFHVDETALLVVDMQADFLKPGGFGELLGNDVGVLSCVVPNVQTVLRLARHAGMRVVYTREGHSSDLSDCSESKRNRGRPCVRIGDTGPLGRVLIRDFPGNQIVEELRPEPGETIIDKPGKGSFYATELGCLLEKWKVRKLIVTGVTTEVCVHSTVREANDRGYECLVLSDCVGSYFPEFHEVALKMIEAQGGIFGWVTDSRTLTEALERMT